MKKLNLNDLARVYVAYEDYEGDMDGGEIEYGTFDECIDGIREFCLANKHNTDENGCVVNVTNTKKLLEKLDEIERNGYVEVDEDGWGTIYEDFYVSTATKEQVDSFKKNQKEYEEWLNRPHTVVEDDGMPF